MNVKEIVEVYLVGYGYDGLYNADTECGCLIGDLAPCSEMSEECRAGYKHQGQDGWEIHEEKLEPKPTLGTNREWLLQHGVDPVTIERTYGFICPDCDGDCHVPAPELMNSASEEPVYRACGCRALAGEAAKKERE